MNIHQRTLLVRAAWLTVIAVELAWSWSSPPSERDAATAGGRGAAAVDSRHASDDGTSVPK